MKLTRKANRCGEEKVAAGGKNKTQKLGDTSLIEHAAIKSSSVNPSSNRKKKSKKNSKKKIKEIRRQMFLRAHQLEQYIQS